MELDLKALQAKRAPVGGVLAYERKFRKNPKDGSGDMYRGKWSSEEDARLKEVVKEFLAMRGVTVEEYQAALSSDDRTGNRSENKKIRGLWIHTGKFFPKRTVESCKNRGERLFHPGSKRGKWTEAEIESLTTLVKEHGRRWVKIGAILNRDPNSVRDKYRLIEERQKGYGKPPSSRWTREEEDKMVDLIKNELKDVNWETEAPLHNIPWRKISREMNRTKASCIEKWHSSLHGRVANYQSKNWNKEEYSTLVNYMKESGAEELDQVPFDKFPLPYSLLICRRAWKSLVRKRKIEQKPFSEQLDLIYRAYCLNEDTFSDVGGDEDDGQESDGSEEDAILAAKRELKRKKAVAAALAASSSSSSNMPSANTSSIAPPPPAVTASTSDSRATPNPTPVISRGEEERTEERAAAPPAPIMSTFASSMDQVSSSLIVDDSDSEEESSNKKRRNKRSKLV